MSSGATKITRDTTPLPLGSDREQHQRFQGAGFYTVGSTGILNCLDFETGEQLWTTNIFEEHEAEAPPWGRKHFAARFSVNSFVVSAGGAVAYHRETGEIAWVGYRNKSGYSSPLLTTLAGVEQIVIFNQGTRHGARTVER